MSNGWSWFVILGVTINVLGVLWLLLSTSKKVVEDEDDDGTTGHEWDGIKELNNPLPKWWFNLFIITIVFTVIYLVLFPGMGNFTGVLNWSQETAYSKKLNDSQERFSDAFSEFKTQDILSLSENSVAMETGSRLFSNYCSTCHGSDARGARGFPNLTDNDWLYGSSEQAIKHTIINGRDGAMPPMEAAVGGPDGAFDVAAYITKDEEFKRRAENGKRLFEAACVACHGKEGRGNHAIGAPNLMDDVWLYGSSMVDVLRTIKQGRRGRMPAHKELLSDDEIYILSAYVLSLNKS